SLSIGCLVSPLINWLAAAGYLVPTRIRVLTVRIKFHFRPFSPRTRSVMSALVRRQFVSTSGRPRTTICAGFPNEKDARSVGGLRLATPTTLTEITMDKKRRIGIQSIALATWLAAVPTYAASSGSNGVEPSIEGTWVGRVTSLVGPPVTFLSMTTFMPGGSIIEENSSPAIRTLAQGEWVKTGSRQFVRTMYLFNFA